MAARRLRLRSRPRGHFTTPTSRTGKGFDYGGRRFVVKGDRFQLEWAGADVYAEIMGAVLAAMGTLAALGDANLKRITPVDTGLLVSTTFAELTVEGARIIVRIGADTYYAIYVEMGTSKMQAQPYIRPTFDLVASRMIPTLQAECRSRGITA